jgi:hypothetical protein
VYEVILGSVLLELFMGFFDVVTIYRYLTYGNKPAISLLVGDKALHEHTSSLPLSFFGSSAQKNIEQHKFILAWFDTGS